MFSLIAYVQKLLLALLFMAKHDYFPYWLFPNMLMFLHSYSQEFAKNRFSLLLVSKNDHFPYCFLPKMMISQMRIGKNRQLILVSLFFLSKTIFAILFMTKNDYFHDLLFMAKTDYFPSCLWPKMVSFNIAYV